MRTLTTPTRGQAAPHAPKLVTIRSRDSERALLAAVGVLFAVTHFGPIGQAFGLLADTLVAVSVTVCVLAVISPDGRCRALLGRVADSFDNGTLDRVVEHLIGPLERHTARLNRRLHARTRRRR